MAATALVFFPGALVEARAYAPLARAVAQAGYRATIVELPRRGALSCSTSILMFLRVTPPTPGSRDDGTNQHGTASAARARAQ